MKTSDIAASCFTDKNTTHSYCAAFYDIEFAKYQNRPISLLEIGVQYGGSIKMWERYFTNAERIVGIDNCLEQWKGEWQDLNFGPNVQIIEADAYLPDTVKDLGQFDIIIDDGPHTLESQMKFVELYTPLLKPGGMLVVEDVPNPNRKDKLIQATPIHISPFNFAVQWVDLTRIKGRIDDYLFVVRRDA